MSARRVLSSATAALLLVATAGCQELPGTRTEQTTTGGALAGAALGAVLADDDNRLMGALLGGALGAGSGYLIGANTDWFATDDASVEAREAVMNAQQNPATPAEALAATTADIDQNGFVTMDELIAMENAGLSDDQILDRLRATDAVFDLTRDQADRLIEAGVSAEVVSQLENINRTDRDQILGTPMS